MSTEATFRIWRGDSSGGDFQEYKAKVEEGTRLRQDFDTRKQRLDEDVALGMEVRRLHDAAHARHSLRGAALPVTAHSARAIRAR